MCEGRLVTEEWRGAGWSSTPWVSRLTPVYLCVSQRQSLCSPSMSKSEHGVTSKISRLSRPEHIGQLERSVRETLRDPQREDNPEKISHFYLFMEDVDL